MSDVRVVVANGSRQVESEFNNKRFVTKVDDAANLPKGIYDLRAAQQPQQTGERRYEGAVIHATKDTVYQLAGNEIIRHNARLFERAPTVGTNFNATYNNGRLVSTSQATQTPQPQAANQQGNDRSRQSGLQAPPPLATSHEARAERSREMLFKAATLPPLVAAKQIAENKPKAQAGATQPTQQATQQATKTKSRSR